MKNKKTSLSLEDFMRKADQIADVAALEKIAGAVLADCHPGGGHRGGGGSFNQFTQQY